MTKKKKLRKRRGKNYKREKGSINNKKMVEWYGRIGKDEKEEGVRMARKKR